MTKTLVKAPLAVRNTLYCAVMERTEYLDYIEWLNREIGTLVEGVYDVETDEFLPVRTVVRVIDVYGF